MRLLAADSLELLCEALPPQLLRCFPSLLTLPVWGSIIGGQGSGCGGRQQDWNKSEGCAVCRLQPCGCGERLLNLQPAGSVPGCCTVK